MNLIIKIEKDEYFWGGHINEGTLMPYKPKFKTDLVSSHGNQTSFLLLSSKGKVIYSDEPFSFTISLSVLNIKSHAPITITTAGSTLRDAYLYAMENHYPLKTDKIEEDLFRVPQFNSWIELVYNQNQEDILKYARKINDEGIPHSVLMIDDNWQEDYGVWDFHPGRFSDPEAMMQELNELGFKVMLWVCPFISPDSFTFRELERKKLLVRNADDRPYIVRWWNGYSGVLDLSNPEANRWFKEKLDYLQVKYGVSGFKFDAGSPSYYPEDCVYYEPSCCRHKQTQKFTEFAAQYPFSELRETCNQPQFAAAQRLSDKNHSWTSNGLSSLIPNSVAQSIMGYQFICPDMIGGGDFNSMAENSDKLDEELIVRYTQASALLPMMQFSAAPWRILSSKNYKLCLDAIKLHTEFSEYILNTVKKSLKTREPVVQPMEYAFPHQNLQFKNQQFMLGDRILVAPVTVKGIKTMDVSLPAGTWTADDGQVYDGGQTVTIDTPLSRLPYFTLN